MSGETESVNAALATLRGELARGRSVLARTESFLAGYASRLPAEPGLEHAMVIAQALSNYYTCCETIFLRISRYFENGLDAGRWHQSLLDKMVLEIPGLRPRVLSDASLTALQELLKFRHFTRYYFDLDYDWNKLRFLLATFDRLRGQLAQDLSRFDEYLAELGRSRP